MALSSMAAAQESSLLLFLLPTSAASVFPPLISVVVLAALLLWLSPGGPAWALSRCRGTPPPPGVAGGAASALSGPAAHRVLAGISRAVEGGAAVMSLSVGLTRLVVASRPETAREILVSPAFGDRPVKDAARQLLFHRAMGFAPSGDAHWRGLRRASAAHLFGPRRVAGSAPEREAIGARIVGDVASLMSRRGEVPLRRVLHAASLGHVMATVFGKRHGDISIQDGELLEEMVTEGYDLLGKFNWADHLPLLRWLDLQGIRRRCNRLVQKVEVFVGKIIQEHKAKRAAGGVAVADGVLGDFVDVLLDLQGEEKMSDSDMIAVLWEMIFRETDTVAILMEWVMARMVMHPEIQAKAQAEVDAAVGGRRGRVADGDVASLPYIQSIVKETLRMHPPGPLLSWARLAVHDARVGGHAVPAGTTAMVNMWAIAHDAAVWPEPDAFRPERFSEGEDVGVLGGDLRLAPFGAGRRVCPGRMLALATAHLWLAQLLHAFDWSPTAAGVDLSERLGMSLEMAAPLVCKAVARA
nr:giant embryo [Oryza sativa Japonica Group]